MRIGLVQIGKAASKYKTRSLGHSEPQIQLTLTFFRDTPAIANSLS
jgi:hypothetical protein